MAPEPADAVALVHPDKNTVLLCDLPDTPAEVGQPLGAGLVRALGLVERDVDPDFAESVRLGLTEDLDAYTARLAAKWGA